MPVLPLAHAGHWLPYVIPAAVVLVAVVIATIREQRRQAGAEGAEGGGDAEPPR